RRPACWAAWWAAWWADDRIRLEFKKQTECRFATEPEKWAGYGAVSWPASRPVRRTAFRTTCQFVCRHVFRTTFRGVFRHVSWATLGMGTSNPAHRFTAYPRFRRYHPAL